MGAHISMPLRCLRSSYFRFAAPCLAGGPPRVINSLPVEKSKGDILGRTRARWEHLHALGYGRPTPRSATRDHMGAHLSIPPRCVLPYFLVISGLRRTDTRGPLGTNSSSLVDEAKETSWATCGPMGSICMPSLTSLLGKQPEATWGPTSVCPSVTKYDGNQ